ncbi:hypothetical protein [Rathayibacter sp. VKM Ac-2630]|uniref:hypothetical protein n=1 Tax=Rathayibacter sp. VKM Ac-2630 TaxID=1938617 RepID=UPI003159186D
MLALASSLAEPVTQLVVVAPEAAPLTGLARGALATEVGVLALVTDRSAADWSEAGFELFEGRTSRGGLPTAYSCEAFVCTLPTTDLPELVRRP